MEQVDFNDKLGRGLVIAVCMNNKKLAYKMIAEGAKYDSEQVLLGVCNGLHDLLADMNKIGPEFGVEIRNLCKKFLSDGCDCGNCRSAGP